ncbi:MAG TPA: AMP-binding protein [Candidatus Methylomirabilis sp.]|nr:AMP-binding protein [Candidatus Methylomirabilis sp.]
MTLARLLERAHERRPEAMAVIDGRRRLTYAGLAAEATALGRGFTRLGVGRGDRVLIALKNRIEHVLAYWALQSIGGVPTPVNFRLSSGELSYIVEDCAPRAIVFESATAPAVEAARARSPLVFVGDEPAPEGVVPFGQLRSSAGAAPVDRVPEENDLSLILYTSGTTGRPKGVPRTHRNHHAGALAHVIQCGYGWGERTLGVMPLYHTMGIHALTSMAAVNGCFVCQADWSADLALSLVEAEQISALYLIPTLFHDLVHSPGFRTDRVTSVRKLAYAGAPMLTPLTDACVKAFRPDVFVNHYGSTEIYTFSVYSDVHTKPGCAGRPGIHSRLRVVVASTERRVRPDEAVPPGEKGEIIASLDSDEAFAGYWNRPDADARALRDGWYFTGDMGYVDETGDLYVAGRVDDMIISGGENIHPVEVEEVLARHPQVKDVAVVGEPDEKWGERVVAFVVPRDAGVTAGVLDQHCRESPDLANFKRPRRIVFVDEIPKTASGKILRRLLRDGHYVEASR